SSVTAAPRALILGGSTGYGLASRIALAYSAGASTISVAYDKPSSGTRTATAGWYNTAAFENAAQSDGLYAKSVNGDAFSNEIKDEVIDIIRRDLGKIDIIVYSLASPVRVDPTDGVRYNSVIKPRGESFSNKSIDVNARTVIDANLEPATDEETRATVKVMGGEDWLLWISALKNAGVLADNVTTVAYSYIGPDVTHAIYRSGTIGAAKLHLERTAQEITEALRDINGHGFVSVNKALVTQASSAIPVVPLYISILYKVMKALGLHEGCIEQMVRLMNEHILASNPHICADGLIHVDDLEMRPDVQASVMSAWDKICTANLDRLSDLDGYRDDFYKLFGFCVPGVDYSADVDPAVAIPSITV
ncbi:MAG: trans-2-enoyl-CoA reductase family protein, partial [Clostridia bacterium]